MSVIYYRKNPLAKLCSRWSNNLKDTLVNSLGLRQSRASKCQSGHLTIAEIAASHPARPLHSTSTKVCRQCRESCGEDAVRVESRQADSRFALDFQRHKTSGCVWGRCSWFEYKQRLGRVYKDLTLFLQNHLIEEAHEGDHLSSPRHNSLSIPLKRIYKIVGYELVGHNYYVL